MPSSLAFVREFGRCGRWNGSFENFARAATHRALHRRAASWRALSVAKGPFQLVSRAAVIEMNSAQHWEAVYQRKQPTEVSWYRPHLDVSLNLVRGASTAAS